jgi:hypothetical protein
VRDSLDLALAGGDAFLLYIDERPPQSGNLAAEVTGLQKVDRDCTT